MVMRNWYLIMHFLEEAACLLDGALGKNSHTWAEILFVPVADNQINMGLSKNRIFNLGQVQLFIRLSAIYTDTSSLSSV